MTIAFASSPATTRPAMQRAQGVAAVSLKAGGRLQGLRQQGAAKAILPRGGAVPEVVFLNTAGGLTGGDSLSFTLELAPGVRATATTQTAERAYRAGGPAARMQVSLRVGAGGHADWLPQETILFQGSSLTRHTWIELDRDASCLLLEAVVLGRAAMGETVTDTRLLDRREVIRDGRPVLADPVRLDPAGLRSGAAGLGGSRAFAMLAVVGQGAEAALAPVRRVLDEPGCRAAASGFDGRLQIRILAADGWPLRRQIVRLLAVLRGNGGGTALPRVWQM